MQAINIPNTHYSKIRKFFELSQTQKDEIYGILRSAGIGSTPTELVEKIVDKNIVDKSLALDIIYLFNNFLGVKLSEENSGKDNLYELIHTAINRLDTKFENSDLVANDLIDLVYSSAESYDLTREAGNAISDSSKIYLESSFQHDIRTIYLADEDRSKHQGVTIINKLKIEYAENGERKELFFTLTPEDLFKFKEKIELAESRIEDIKAIPNIKFIEVK